MCEDYQPIEGWIPELGRPIDVPRKMQNLTDAEIEALPLQERKVREDGVVELTFPRREAR